MDVTGFAIRNNRLTLVALLAILLAGAGAYSRLPRAEDPGFTIRTAVVRTIFPGANPERVENLVTDKIEKTIQENNLKDRVTYYLSDNFQSIPDTEIFDLVVANPPNY